MSAAAVAARRLLRPSTFQRVSVSTLALQDDLVSRVISGHNPNCRCTTCARASAARSFSSSPEPEPARYVQGVSAKDLESDPNIASFFASNFAEESEETTEEDDDEIEMMAPDEDVEEEISRKPSGPVPVADEALLARNIRPLSCYLRPRETEDGSRACRVLREQHRLIPGLLYGSDPTQNVVSVTADSKVSIKTPWNQIQRELDRYHHGFSGRVYELSVYESEEAADAADPEQGLLYKQLVKPTDVQRHPIQNKLYCVNYLRYHPGRPVKIPIRYINEEESPALKRDGYIVPINRTVECFIEEGAVIPEAIELECTGLQLKAKLRRDHLIFPEGVTPSFRVKPDFLIGVVFCKTAAAEDEEEGAGGEGEGE